MAQEGIQSKERWQKQQTRRAELHRCNWKAKERKMEMRRENRSRQEESGAYRNAMKVMELFTHTHTDSQTNKHTNKLSRQ